MKQCDPELLISIKKYCESYYIENHCSPTRRNIANEFKISTSKVQRYLEKLSDDGQFTCFEDRNIKTYITDKVDTEMVTVALVGEIACGTPILAEENISEYFNLPVSLIGRGKFFMLKANGDSMINANINDGDKIVIRQQNTAEEGEIIVALIDNEATLKRFYTDKKNKRFRLHPENNAYDDIYVKDLQIQGVAVKVIKDLV